MSKKIHNKIEKTFNKCLLDQVSKILIQERINKVMNIF